MEKKMIRGFYAIGVADFCDNYYSVKDREKILSFVPPELRSARTTLLRNEWYPLRFLTDYCVAVEKANEGDYAKTHKEITKAGQFIANEATTGFLKLLIKVLTPKMFVRQFPEFWSKYHSFGKLESDLSLLDQNRASFRVNGYEHLHSLGTGYLTYVFEKIGRSDVTVNHNVPAAANTVPELQWDVSWR